MTDKQEGFQMTDDPIDVNEQGGKQSAVPYAFELIPPLALLAVARVMREGKKYDTPGEQPNYYKVAIGDHLNHALGHIIKFMAHNEDEPHLTHAACRLLMAIGCAYDTYMNEGTLI